MSELGKDLTHGSAGHRDFRLGPKGEIEEALRAEVDLLCEQACDLPLMSVSDLVNLRLRETLLRLADRLKETA